MTDGLASLDIGETIGIPSVTQVTAKLSSLHLEDHESMPGAFSPSSSAAPRLSLRNTGPLPFSTETESLETLVTAATLTATPMDTSTHDKLFTSSAQFYEHKSSTLPTSIQSLDVNTAMQGLEAAAKPKKTLPRSPAFRPGRQFGRSPLPNHSKPRSRSPSPTPPKAGKIEQEELNALDRLQQTFDRHYSLVFDSAFASLAVDLQCVRLDEATKFLLEGLARIEELETKMRSRNTKDAYRRVSTGLRPESKGNDQSLKTRRDQLRNRMRNFHAQICAIYAPLSADRPIEVDAGEHRFLFRMPVIAHSSLGNLFPTDFTRMDQINQVLILLGVICNMIIGLSIVQCNFLIGIAVMCVKLGMSTVGSEDSSLSHEFSSSQNEIISQMPSSLIDALKKFGVDGHFDLYATCPACNFTNKAHPLAGKKDFYEYPESCANDIVGENGISKCGANLLKRRRDGTVQPIKPYLVNSLPDYIARCLSDPTYLDQSTKATDDALHSIETGESETSVENVFEAAFIKDFKGPDGKLFVDRGDKIRLAFSMHVDFFNPNGITQRGAHNSIGVISCANLALDPSIRYLPENMFVGGIIPGPNEPSADELDHFVRPIVEQFVRTWRPGLKVSSTARSKSGAVVEAGLLLSVNDLPAARKVAGFQGPMSNFICTICKLRGTHQIFDTDHKRWIPRDVTELRQWSTAYRDAQTLDERKAIFNEYGVRWSSLWLLDYWDPTKMLVIDAMHCILEGIVHYHCRHVLRLDASASKLSADGLKYAYEWDWTPYDPETAPANLQLKEKNIPSVTKIQSALCLALEGEKSLTLNKMWTRLDNQGTKDALQFVVHSLGLSTQLDSIPESISTLYVERARQKSKRNPDQVKFPHRQLATKKNQLIALLLTWVSLYAVFEAGKLIPLANRDCNNLPAPRHTYSRQELPKLLLISRR